jgi:hypothetical protein
MLKECECGHKFVEHEKCDDIRPCFHFTKDGDSGINLSVCSCKDYKEKKVSVPITP